MEHIPAAKTRTRQINGSWGKVRVGGGAAKAYIQDQETDTKQWKSSIHFTNADPDFTHLADKVFEWLSDNPLCTKEMLTAKKKEFAADHVDDGDVANLAEVSDGDETAPSMKIRFCDFWSF